MNHLLILLSAVVFFFNVPGDKVKLNGDWLMVCYSDAGIPFEKCAFYEHRDYIVKINFSGGVNSGKFKANTPSNYIGGNYTIDQNEIFLDSVSRTKVNEWTDFGRVFWNDIIKFNTFKAGDDSLVFFYENNLKSMKFIRLRQSK